MTVPKETDLPVKVSISWDDGHPADLRVADYLERHSLSATFYIPLANVEGRPVMGGSAICSIASRFEIGAHTLDHVPLPTLAEAEQHRQIAGSKARLEQLTSGRISSFCYPLGRVGDRTVALVKQSGYTYARTTKNFIVSPPADPFVAATTLQLFPHQRFVYARNLLRYGLSRERLRLFLALVSKSDLRTRVVAAYEVARLTGGTLHLWGHSWEIQEFGLWSALNDTLAFIAGLVKDRAALVVENRALAHDASAPSKSSAGDSRS